MEAICCKGCDQIIEDRFLLLVEPDQLWHSTCLRCQMCKRELESDAICHVTKKGAFCTTDYQFLTRKTRSRAKLRDKSPDSSILENSPISSVHNLQTHCARCASRLYSYDMVCNVGKNLTFHYPQCLICLICEKPLKPGSAVLYISKGLICAAHKSAQDHGIYLPEFEYQCEFEPGASEVSQSDWIRTSLDSDGLYSSDQVKMAWTQSWYSDPEILHNLSDTTLPLTSERFNHERFAEFPHCTLGKQARMRTVLNEQQLTALRTCYSINPRPDTSTKQQLALMTGLNLRVIRVWFQNKRCKDKKCRNQTQPASTTPDSTDSSSYFVIDYDNLDSDDIFVCD